jgi:hypothetical protein
MIGLIGQLIALFGALYAIAMTVSFVYGLLRFLIAAPSAIRADLEVRRRRAPDPEPRDARYVANEVETRRALPPARRELPPES